MIMRGKASACLMVLATMLITTAAASERSAEAAEACRWGYDRQGSCMHCRFRVGRLATANPVCATPCGAFCHPSMFYVDPFRPVIAPSAWSASWPSPAVYPLYAELHEAVPCSEDHEILEGAMNVHFTPTELLEVIRPFALRFEESLASEAADLDPALVMAMLWLREGPDGLFARDGTGMDYTVEGFGLTKPFVMYRVTEFAESGGYELHQKLAPGEAERWQFDTRFDVLGNPYAVRVRRYRVHDDVSELAFHGTLEISSFPVDTRMISTSDNYYAPIFAVTGFAALDR